MQLESLTWIYSSVPAIKLLTSCLKCSLSLSPPTEEVADRHQSDCGGVALRGRGELLREALLSPAASVRADVQQPLDVFQAAVQGLQASSGLCEHPQTGGEGLGPNTHTHTHIYTHTHTHTQVLCQSN